MHSYNRTFTRRRNLCLLRKGYETFREFDKSDKGHRDKEQHKYDYDEENGEEKKKHEEAGHYGEEHHGEDGEKSAKFGEEGKHEKGHNTKGEHSVFKKVCKILIRCEKIIKSQFFSNERDINTPCVNCLLPVN